MVNSSRGNETQYLDGRLVARVKREQLRQDILQIPASLGRALGLAVVLVGDDPASHVYVRNKEKACQSVGIESRLMRMPSTVATEDVVDVVEQLNQNANIDGILVQLPLPPQVNRIAVIEAIHPDKDVDGLTATNQGRLLQGRPGLIPCTPLGIMDLLQHYSIVLSEKRVAVIGRSLLVGLPVSLLMMKENATVTMIHSKTANPESMSRDADIVVAAAGRPKLVNRRWVKEGAVVIDVGIHRTESGLVGDCDVNALDGYVRAISPVPGGIGPMTIQELLSNTFKAYRARCPSS